MTDCERLSDRMPEVARGTAAWTRDDTAHLARCTACQDEWELVRAAATHGMALGFQVDAGRLAEQVERRLRQEPAVAPQRVVQPWRRAAWPVALAAGVALMVWAGPRVVPSSEALPETIVAVLHELDDLTETELEAMLDVVDDPASLDYRGLDTPDSLGDLSDEELQLLLNSMED